MRKKISQHLLVFLFISGFLLLARSVGAQDFGTNAVSNGLGGVLSSSDPRTIVGRIINIALGLLGVIAVGLIIYAGFLWMTSDGEEDKVEKAKKLLKNAVIGLVIILSSWAIATFILSRLNGAMLGGGGSSCISGESQPCGCGGYMLCNEGSWGQCLDSDCGGGGIGQESCDTSPDAGCQAASQKCDTSRYCDTDDCACKPKGEIGEACDADLNNATCDPDNNRCAEYLTCNPDTCTCLGSPVITEISPAGGFCDNNVNQTCTIDTDCGPNATCNRAAPNGTANNLLTIFGKNFGEYSATSSKIVFIGDSHQHEGRQPAEINPNCINSWSNEQIVIAVPDNVGTGPIKITDKDGLEDSTDNHYGPDLPDFIANTIARPGLCYLDPNRGVLSSRVSYQGINLYSGDAYFGNYQNNVKGLNSSFSNSSGLMGTSTIPNIRAGDSGSFVVNNINGNREKSNYLKFTKDYEAGDGPYIVSFSPTSGNAGQYVTIRGNGFGGARGNNKVSFLSSSVAVEAAYDFPDVCLNSVWKNDQIIVKTPAGLPDGDYEIKIIIGTTTIGTERLNPRTFQADNNLELKTSLCKIDPLSGSILTPVTLWGEYFGRLNSEGLVKFNYDKSAIGNITQDNGADSLKTAVPLDSITGPVKVIKNNNWGNELNFAVGACVNNADCGNTQICCPSNTYKKGRCEAALSDCFINIPTSVFEWNFSTVFKQSTTTDFYSCAGMAQYLGSCQTGAFCPNTIGVCSPYAGTGKKAVADCDYSCSTISGCNDFGPNNCTYNTSLDKCLKNGAGANCDLAQPFTYTLGAQTFNTTKVCNKDKHWEISVATSCPNGWTRASGNRCVNLKNGQGCNICSADFTCEDVAGLGRCASDKICPSGATCENSQVDGEPDKCLALDKASCNCCCEIGFDARDCCAPLTCEGTCGADTTNDDAGLGKCGGCATVGTTTADHDAACNCAGHSGQYCDINLSHPNGVCTDCTSLATSDSCTDHSLTCCLDANKTANSNDDFCRSGSGRLISNSPLDQDFGYCAYYNCQTASSTPPGDPRLCASSTPFKLAAYNTIDKCTQDCQQNPGTDYCSTFNGNQNACLAENICCFDQESSNCLGSNRINGGIYNGYCAYYNCQTASSTPPGDPKLCDFNAQPTGQFITTSACIDHCANEDGGAGLSCVSKTASSSCQFEVCNLPNFSCLTVAGSLGAYPDCGTCCCDPSTPTTCATPEAPNLYCQADKGSCSGAGRGLCCGCSKDSECGTPNTVGCGSDTCCSARPSLASSSPAHLANNVCRNIVVKATFDQVMDITSFNDNALLLEERDYGNGVCPAGTFISEGGNIQDVLAYQKKSFLARAYQRLIYSWHKISSRLSGRALADIPNPNKLYCAIPGSISSETNNENTSLVFAPKKLLSPSTNYYLIVKGDESLNSQLGVLNSAKIGMNGEGYLNPTTNGYIEGELINFNNKAYKNSRIIKFTTLSAQSSLGGICDIDHVSLFPNSYLFKSSDNSLDENDNNLNDPTFNTKADKDKVFSAWAYSSDGQALQPITGYFWDWNIDISDANVALISPVLGLPTNQVFVSAKTGVTDGETKIKATINMSRFLTSCDSSPTCSCQGDNCSNNCCNVYSAGDGQSKLSDIFVFICNNPWPPLNIDGSWSPWVDADSNCLPSTGNCSNYNYKFYYCRDSGNPTTLDDLPAITNQAVVRGQSSTLVCSSDKTPCANLGGACGLDKNGDSNPDGLCIWNVLKESYFFREATPLGGELKQVIDKQTGAAVDVLWDSPAGQADSYKIYYLPSGRSNMLVKEVKAADVCNTVNGLNVCSTVINNLTNNLAYIFKVSVVSVQRVESQLSNELTATPTDKVPPLPPSDLQALILNNSSTIKFSWTPNNDIDTPVSGGEGDIFYRLYHGLNPGLYGESFDSAKNVTSLSFPLQQFTVGNNYFAVSALDVYGNESARSSEIQVIIPVN